MADGFIGKDKGKLQEAIQVMQKATGTAESLEHGKDIASEIKKRIALVQKDMGKL